MVWRVERYPRELVTSWVICEGQQDDHEIRPYTSAPTGRH